MPTLRFNADDHSYFLDGVRVPSVTQIMAPLHDFSAIPADVLQHASERGTAIHKAIELDLDNNLDEDSIHAEVRPYLRAWRKFYVEWEPEVLASERRVGHLGLRYAGTLDCLLRARGDLYYVDYKNTAALVPTVGMQLKAYQEADKATEAPAGYPTFEELSTAKRAMLWLRNDGTYKFIEQPDHDWALFLALLSQHHTNQKVQMLVDKWRKAHV